MNATLLMFALVTAAPAASLSECVVEFSLIGGPNGVVDEDWVTGPTGAIAKFSIDKDGKAQVLSVVGARYRLERGIRRSIERNSSFRPTCQGRQVTVTYHVRVVERTRENIDIPNYRILPNDTFRCLFRLPSPAVLVLPQPQPR